MRDCRYNIDQITLNKMTVSKGTVRPDGAYLGLREDGEPVFHPAQATRPHLLQAGDRQQSARHFADLYGILPALEALE